VSRSVAVVALSLACSWTGGAPAPAAIAFVDTPTTWEIAHADGKATATLLAGKYRLDIGSFDGACGPASELPFTEVDGNVTFAALACRNPEGAPFDVALVEVPSPDPAWPTIAGLAVVATQAADEGKILMRAVGMVEIPMGVVPKPPALSATDARPPAPAEAAPADGGAAPTEPPPAE
jgi:hypothetical protein